MIKTNEKNNQLSASPWRRLVPCSLCSYWVSHDLLDGSDIVLGSFHDLFIVSYGLLFVPHNLLIFFDWISIQLSQDILGNVCFKRAKEKNLALMH